MRYSGELFHRVRLPGLVRDLPLVEVIPHLWIASDAELVLGDVEFVSKAAELLAAKIKMRVDVVMTAEAKSIALAFELSKRLGHQRFVVARKSVKAYMGEHISHEVRSITTKTEQPLILTSEDADWISGKKICILDDVVSTGATFKALDALVSKAGGKTSCKAAVWKEGPWYRDRKLVYIDTLPVFVDEQHPLASQI
jgi:adenine phosphoribosyltransferase